jgi:hypothetical protein
MKSRGPAKKPQYVEQILSKLQLPESQIYRVHVLDEFGNPAITIVFSRGMSPSDTEKGVSEDTVFISENQIHLDDSVRTVKQKIVSEIQKNTRWKRKFAYEEMYLFGVAKEGTEDDNHVRIGYRLDTDNNATDTPIQTSPPINPYLLNLETSLPNPPPKYYVFENSLLLNYGPFANNHLYVCFAENVLENVHRNSSSLEMEKTNSEYIIQTYFPLLREYSIFSLDGLVSQKTAMIKRTTSQIHEVEPSIQGVQLFYDVFNLTERNVKYVQKGVRSVRFAITPQNANRLSLPLEMIFKRIHCSRNIPFIKYNPGNRRENLYRLFYEKITSDGKKIPILTHKQILKLSRETGKTNQISLFVNPEHGTPTFYIHFEHTGEIVVYGVHTKALSVSDWDNTIRTKLNPIFAELNREFRQTGYTISSFDSLANSHIRIINLHYSASTRIEMDIQISKIDCIYHLLTVNHPRGVPEPIIRYKRVENFTEMDAETAFIAELYAESKHTGISANEMMEMMAERFGKSEEYVRQRFIDFFKTDTEFERTVVDHPGFPMKIQIANLDTILEFEIENIDSIYYLEPLEVYIESIVQITQQIKPKSDLKKYIQNMCTLSSKAPPVNEPQIANVISTGIPRENAIMKNIRPVMLMADTEDTDLFKDLGIELEAEEDAVLSEHEEEIQLDDNIHPDTVAGLFDELYKNTNRNEPLPTTDIGPVTAVVEKEPVLEEPPLVAEKEPVLEEEIEKEKPPLLQPAPILEEKKEKEEPPLEKQEPVLEEKKEETTSTVFAPLSQVSNMVMNAISPSSTPEEEKKPPKVEEKKESEPDVSDDTATPENAIYYSEDDNDSRDGGAPRKKDKTNIANVAVENVATQGRIRPDGLSLSQPNPFLQRLQTRDPALFVTNATKQFKSYSSACQPTSRHPIILTDEEKQRIDRENPGSYKHAVKYGSDPDNAHWFICPRFWCFLTNSSISEKDAHNPEKCGTIIPDDAEVIPPGAYVYEFKGKDRFDTKGNPVEHYPGFLNEGKHPNGYCLPCCFKNWDNEHQKTRRNQCNAIVDVTEAEAEEDEPENGKTKRKRVRKPKADANRTGVPQSELYIISLDTYPLPHTRWGYLPIPAQLFLNIDYKSVVNPQNPATIIADKPTLLRYGVEQTPTQSFLGVFADIYSSIHAMPTPPSIEEFKQILAREITLDIFMNVHNSSLVTAFSNKRSNETGAKKKDTKKNGTKENDDNDEIMKKALSSNFAKRLNMTKLPEKRLFEDTVATYRTFLEFITHPTETIDHTYLWDIFTSNIPTLNRGGLNLVMFEIMESDITDRIQYICPTNRYSKNIYDAKKPSILVLKRGEYYEPVYEFLFQSDSESISANKTFKHTTINENIKRLLTNIQQTSARYCSPLPSLPRVYRMKEPIPLLQLLAEVRARSYEPLSQIINYRNKVIGITVRTSNPSHEVFLPCFPTSPLSPIEFGKDDIRHMNDPSIWKDYTSTRDALLQIYTDSQHKIPCNPRVKIVEDEMVVGFITETNQFIQVMPPLKDQIDDGIPVEKMTNHITADIEIATNTAPDKVRTDMMSRIRLENQFYLAFRSTVRGLLNDYTNHSVRQSILDTIESLAKTRSSKLSKIEEQLRTLVANNVVFVDIDFDVLRDMDEINNCYDDSTQPYCILKDNTSPQLSIPKTNLLSEMENRAGSTDNEKLYFMRLSDELLRYNRVRLFMFDSDKYFNMVDVNYKIHPNEFILTQSTIQSDTVGLQPISKSSYIQNTGYDTATPSVHYPYIDSVISFDEQYARENTAEVDSECIHSIINIVGNPTSLWRRSFPNTAKEVVFKNTAVCSFYVMMVIFKSYTGKSHTILQIKEKLWEGYSRLFDRDPLHLARCVEILGLQGKKKLMDPVVRKQMSFDARLFSEEYYLSDLDIWVLASSFQLPIVLFNPNSLKGFSLAHKIEWIICSRKSREKYFFIRSTITNKTVQYSGISQYHLVQPTFALSETREFHSLSVRALQGDSEYIRNVWTIEQMLAEKQYVPNKTPRV